MKKQIVLALALATTAFAATAAERSYTYAEAGWARTVVDFDANSSAGFDGYTVRGSYGIGEFHVFGGYTSVNNDELVDLDLNESQLGMGYHHAIDDNADVIVEASFLREDVKAQAFGIRAKDHAYARRFSAGLRGQLGQHIEATAKANYIDSSTAKSEVTPSLNVLWKINDTFGIFAEGESGKEFNRYAAGVRASF